MIVLHVAKIDNYKASGIDIVVPEHIKNQSKHITVGLLNCSSEKFEWNKNEYEFEVFNINSNLKFDITNLKQPFNRPDLVVFHSIYYKKFCEISKNLNEKNISYIIVPHGSLTNSAQSKKRLKKFFGNLLLFNKFISDAKYIQYLTEKEKMESTKWLNKSYVCGNGMYIKKIKKSYKDDKFNIVFIGRLDTFHKGLDVLLEACKLIKEEMIKKNILLKIYGPDYQFGKKKVEVIINKYNLEKVVVLNNEIYDEEKDRVLENTDIFILTSRFEGQPLSIMEALSKGIPVIATPGTNFADKIEENNLGWKAEFSAEDIAKQIIEAYNSKNKLDIYSNNAINYAKNNFSWENISIQTIKYYREIIEELTNNESGE